MQKLHILIDCDEVLNNLTQDWIRLLNRQHGLSVPVQRMRYEEVFRAFAPLSREETKLPWADGTLSGHWTVKDGSYEVMKQMLDDGHEISIVTAHNNRTCGTKFDWILHHFPFINHIDIIICAKKQKIIGDVLIDDSVNNLEGGSFMKILFDHPNNHDYNAAANGMIRVYTLNEAYEAIKKERNLC